MSPFALPIPIAILSEAKDLAGAASYHVPRDPSPSAQDDSRELLPQTGRLKFFTAFAPAQRLFRTCMDSISQFFHMITTPEGFRQLISWGGYVVLALIVFAETGLLVGFFLPGDSLLVTAGVLAAAGLLDIVLLNLLLIPAAIIGDATGYSLGRRSGKRLLNRPDSRFFKKSHVEKTQEFYAKHGGKTIILARFIPVIRTFAPVVAGIAGMPYKEFAVYNIMGGVLWIASTTLVGYFLGRQIHDIEKYLHYVIGVVIILSLLPVAIEYMKMRARRKKAIAGE